jgi:hypothetical protein
LKAPHSTATFSRWIRRSVSETPTSAFDCESPNTASSLAPFMLLMPPALLISSTAAITPARVWLPTAAEPPDSGSTQPIFTVAWAKALVPASIRPAARRCCTTVRRGEEAFIVVSVRLSLTTGSVSKSIVRIAKESRPIDHHVNSAITLCTSLRTPHAPGRGA